MKLIERDLPGVVAVVSQCACDYIPDNDMYDCIRISLGAGHTWKFDDVITNSVYVNWVRAGRPDPTIWSYAGKVNNARKMVDEWLSMPDAERAISNHIFDRDVVVFH